MRLHSAQSLATFLSIPISIFLLNRSLTLQIAAAPLAGHCVASRLVLSIVSPPGFVGFIRIFLSPSPAVLCLALFVARVVHLSMRTATRGIPLPIGLSLCEICEPFLR
jgi:hypothetical protein